VIDACVAAKWFLPDEPYSAMALELLRSATAGTTGFIVPDLFFSECGNILWKATRHQRLTVGETRAAIRVIEDLQTVMVPAATLLEGILQIAQSYDRTFYDSLYIVLPSNSRPIWSRRMRSSLMRRRRIFRSSGSAL